MQKRRFFLPKTHRLSLQEGWAFLLRSSRGGVSRLLSIGREGFADPFRPSLFMASRENWAYAAQTETILASSAVRAVGGTHRLHMEAEFTPLYDSCCILRRNLLRSGVSVWYNHGIILQGG
jgi:hypothetical protein